MATMKISDILASQVSLLQEASEALPHQFSQCTYNLGYIRQAVYLCRTCSQRRGICSACSIACHSDHDQLELFPKRKFRCDCPTAALAHPCSLHHKADGQEPVNALNEYGRNFDGVFCRCGREYDAQTEIETMIQCLACEDWYHESCLNLRERPISRAPTPEPSAEAPSQAEGQELDDADAHSEASSSGLPPALITASMYDVLVCGACVAKIDTLRRYAGTPGVLMVVRDTLGDKWKIIGHPEDQNAHVDIGAESKLVDGATAGDKRPLSPSVDETQQAKRPRTSSPGAESKPSTESSAPAQPCLAPCPNPQAQEVLSAVKDGSSRESAVSLGAGDIFLTHGWRDRWCRCSSCSPSLEANSFLLEEDETYEPPEDPDSGLSLEELGLRALGRLPREKALNGIQAFNEMRDQLMSHLRPFAEQDKEVTEADIKAFFEAKMSGNESK
ncbi:zf-UBR domain-containing protein [Phanerochaete sordida]|uniref:Zf-UBR domain-containing protein n=1 Tax=Phanerochaete sordida TaxID=48140 RepID=A0A9P3GDP3_9APHY|nr:zf-UBR domain-containing protein [Phanerochaete sordida]